MTQIYGILGSPVSHSRSPAMHNAAFEALGIDARYVAFDVPPAKLADGVRGLTALGVSGANVTVPHKTTIMPELGALTPEARAIGAVNTLVRAGETWVGHNTDAPGLARQLREAEVVLRGARVVVLGAGGAARASVVGLAQEGTAEIVVAARRLDQAQAVARDLQPICPCPLRAISLSAVPLGEAFAQATLLVQSTSASLGEHAAAFAASLPLATLPPEASVVDLVYKPRDTAVLRAAEARGLRCIDGLGMLLHQGALAFELWTERTAPLAAMRDALGVP